MRSKIQGPKNFGVYSGKTIELALRCEVAAQVSDGFSLVCLETCIRHFTFTGQDVCQFVVSKLNDKLDTLEDIRATYNQCLSCQRKRR